jgi:NADPH:quinone reductase-like Zn-dependent oxidoreductase
VRAIVVREAGGPSALRLEELPTPSPGPDELTIDVAYAGTGLVDTLFRSGDRHAHQRRHRLAGPARPALTASTDSVVVLGPGGTTCRLPALLPGRRVVGVVSRGVSRAPAPLGEAAAVHQAFADRTAPPKTVLDVSA